MSKLLGHLVSSYYGILSSYLRPLMSKLLGHLVSSYYGILSSYLRPLVSSLLKAPCEQFTRCSL
jgi:hypothetical protein